jgi:hypothetical protein
MDAMSRAARQQLPALRRRFAEGLPPGQTILVKTGLQAGEGREYVWISVCDWRPDGAIVGQLEQQPGARGRTSSETAR